MTNKEFFIKSFSSEMDITAGAVNALPDDMSKLSYKPNPKSRTALELVEHMLPHTEAMNNAVTSFVINEEGREFKSREEAVEFLKKNVAEVVEGLKSVDDKTWEEKMIPFMFMGNKIMDAPMHELYWLLLKDMIHHRGQLSTYYRPMGVRNPSIYGPTADDEQTG